MESIKRYAWVIIFLIVLFSVWYAEHTYQLRVRAGLESDLTEALTTTQHHKNELNQMVAENIIIQGSLRQIQKSHAQDLKSLESQFNVKERALRAYLTATVKVTGSGPVVTRDIYRRDTVIVHSDSSFWVQDRYLDLSGELHGNYNYTYTDTINFIVSSKRKWLLGAKTYYVNGALSNPRATIPELKAVDIITFKEKRFSVGPAILWSPFTPTTPVLGFGITYALFKF